MSEEGKLNLNQVKVSYWQLQRCRECKFFTGETADGLSVLCYGLPEYAGESFTELKQCQYSPNVVRVIRKEPSDDIMSAKNMSGFVRRG